MADLSGELGPPDAELYSGCPGVRQVAWGQVGVLLQAEGGQQITHIWVFEGSSPASERVSTVSVVVVGDGFDAVRGSYEGQVTDQGEDLYGNRITFDSGPDAGVEGFYDPTSGDLAISELSIGPEVCGD